MSPAPVSQAFIEVMQQVDRVADTNVPVLLTGESEIGRALIASTIHHRSSRRDRPFVAVDCATIPPESIEAQVFDQDGFWEEADDGTLFLDQITEIATSFQMRLLRALQTGEMRVRVLAGTNRDVEQEVAAGKFDSELFSCLSGTSIVLPPLRQRSEGIAPNDDWVSLSVIEGRYVARVLEHTGGNKQAAARLLAVDRKTLDRMIKRHHIDSNHVKALRAKASSRT
jgi:DNA-binding NtrC family response regulator